MKESANRGRTGTKIRNRAPRAILTQKDRVRHHTQQGDEVMQDQTRALNPGLEFSLCFFIPNNFALVSRQNSGKYSRSDK